MKPLVIRHAHCPDGAAAAWAVERHLGDVDHFAASYNEPPPDVAGRRVVIVDFSYPLDVMQAIAAEAEHVVILDHHQSAIDELRPWLETTHRARIEWVLDASRSGCRIAWDFYNGSVHPPRLLAHVEDRDLWRFALADTRNVMAAVTSYPMTPATIEMLVRYSPIADLVKEGHAINRFRDQLIEAAVEGAVEVTIGGHQVLAANCPYTVGSDVAGILAKGRPFGAYWFVKGHTEHWGLRSSEDGLDVAELAQRFGGGGHKHASGFRVDVVREGME